MNKRELATILAALRCRQADPMRGTNSALDEISHDGGTLVPMDADEIDELCERLNTGGLR